MGRTWYNYISVCDFISIITRYNRFKTSTMPMISMLFCEIYAKVEFKSKDTHTLCISVVKLESELIIYLNIIFILYNLNIAFLLIMLWIQNEFLNFNINSIGKKAHQIRQPKIVLLMVCPNNWLPLFIPNFFSFVIRLHCLFHVDSSQFVFFNNSILYISSLPTLLWTSTRFRHIPTLVIFRSLVFLNSIPYIFSFEFH